MFLEDTWHNSETANHNLDGNSQEMSHEVSELRINAGRQQWKKKLREMKYNKISILGLCEPGWNETDKKASKHLWNSADLRAYTGKCRHYEFSLWIFN